MIKIKENYSYFTHLLGKESVIPLSNAILQAFPCKIIIFVDSLKVTIDLKIDGEVLGFTHLLNIEKARVEVFGHAKSYFHLLFFAKDNQIFIELQRGTLDILIDEKPVMLIKKQKIFVTAAKTIEKPAAIEKISFGCAKKPLLEKNIDRETKLYSLSQLMEDKEILPLEIFQIHPLLQDLFSPKNQDDQYRNLNLPKIEGDRFALFSTFRKKIKERFCKQEGNFLYFLPGGKDLAHAGRATLINMGEFSFDILWKKAKAVKLTIYPHFDGAKVLFLGKKYRVKNYPNEKGKWHNSLDLLNFKKDKKIYIDRIDY